MTIEIERVGGTKDLLGESPWWDAAGGRLYWLDVEGRKIQRYEPASGAVESWPTPGRPGSMVLDVNGAAIVAMEDGFHRFAFETGTWRPLARLALDGEDRRFNDGKVDRQGRFVAGTMCADLTTPGAALYRLDEQGTVTVVDEGIVCSNGPCWSPDGTTLYFADSPRRTIYAYDYDPDSGAAGNKRPFVTTDRWETAPDGATVDAEGFLWTAFVLTGRVARFAPSGRFDDLVQMPVSHPSSVMFGGPGLDVLYVTSISTRLRRRPPEEPEAGGLFRVKGLGVAGLPEPRYRG